MVYQMSVLVLQPGKGEAYNQLEKEGVSMGEKTGARLIGAWRTTIGDMFEVTSITAFESMAKREEIMASMQSSKEWAAWLQKLVSISASWTMKIMTPTPASPMK